MNLIAITRAPGRSLASCELSVVSRAPIARHRRLPSAYPTEARQEMVLGRLDYLYSQSDDVAADLRFFVDVLGGEQVFAIEDGGTQVAMVSLGEAPAILLTNHLVGDRPVHVYAVDDLETSTKDLEGRGWTRERAIELPTGPAVTFRTPGGLRFALYQSTRPFVLDSFRGRRDFG